MRFSNIFVDSVIFGLAASSAIPVSDETAIAIRDEATAAEVAGDDKSANWHPITRQPHFFNLRVNDRCDP